MNIQHMFTAAKQRLLMIGGAEAKLRARVERQQAQLIEVGRERNTATKSATNWRMVAARLADELTVMTSRAEKAERERDAADRRVTEEGPSSVRAVHWRLMASGLEDELAVMTKRAEAAESALRAERTRQAE